MAQVSSDDQLQPYDAPLSFPEPSFLWSRWMCLRGINNKKLTEADVPVKDLTGKWILITGGNNGIGEQAVYFFARCGANMVLASRVSPNEKHPAAVVEQCRRLANAAGHEKSVIEWWAIDMLNVATLGACKDACAKNTQCQTFEAGSVDGSGNNCWLFDTSINALGIGGATTGWKWAFFDKDCDVS
ncbi:hypothetical protein NQ176_g4763 [Zarea fungicola]|uniref:Uncharacterized protein n=1 Tax=Zarea fungicola TaxID=93591 RepID=A0ACC1NCR0_9HYPO|nr:hypothetical protein NQ176_g4763 [Lecanicillium fungicola]